MQGLRGDWGCGDWEMAVWAVFCTFRAQTIIYMAMEQKKDRTFLWVIIGLITILVLIFILQNREETTIRFLGINVDGPRYLVFLILYGIGFLSGWLWRFLRRGKKNMVAKESGSPAESDKG